MNEVGICLFARAPVQGQVKTRLQPVLNSKQACSVHKALLQHTIERVNTSNWTLQLWTTDSQHSFIQQCARDHALSVFQQQGNDLGERMLFAVQRGLMTMPYVIIIGTDCPDIDKVYIDEAVNCLQQGNDVVIGPAEDGGYVLIGMSSPIAAVFMDIPWGTDKVMEITRQRLQKLGINWQALSVQRDIDRPADLIYLQENYPSIGVSAKLPQSDQEPG